MNLKTFSLEISTLLLAMVIFPCILASIADEKFETSTNQIYKSIEAVEPNIDSLNMDPNFSYLTFLLDRIMADVLAYKIHLKKVADANRNIVDSRLNNEKRGHIWKRLSSTN